MPNKFACAYNFMALLLYESRTEELLIIFCTERSVIVMWICTFNTTRGLARSTSARKWVISIFVYPAKKSTTMRLHRHVVHKVLNIRDNASPSTRTWLKCYKQLIWGKFSRFTPKWFIIFNYAFVINWSILLIIRIGPFNLFHEKINSNVFTRTS